MLYKSRQLLIRAVLLGQLASFAAVGLLIAVRHAQRDEQAARTLLPYSQAAAIVAGERMRAVERQLHRLAIQVPTDARQLQAFRQEMQRLQDREGFEQIALITVSGEPLLDTGMPPGAWNVAVPWDVSQVNLSVPVVHDEGLSYSLLATLPTSRLLSGVSLPPGWTAMVADSGGHLLARSSQTALALGPVLDADDKHAIEQKRSGVLEVQSSQGVPLVTAFTRTDARGWTSMVSAPRSELYAAGWRTTAYEAIAATLLMSAGAWLTLRFASSIASVLDERRRDAELHGETSARRLESVLSMASDAIVVSDADDRIVLANDAARHLFRFIGRPLLDAHVGLLLAPDTWAQYQSLPGNAATLSGHARRGRGTTFQIEYSVSRFRDGAGNVFRTLVVSDVSARQRQEDMLLEARGELHRMNHAFDTALAREAESRQAAIASELHDAVGSSLAGVSLLLGTAYSFVREPEIAALISKSQEQVMLTSQQVRQIARGIMPAGQERGALLPALEQFAADLSAVPGLSCSIRSRGDFDEVPAQVGGHLFRIVQEATNNALRHGHALRVRITLAQAGPWCRLTVCDDGAGFDPAKRVGALSGIGMKSMRARAEAIGGRFSVVNSPGHALKVQVTWLCKPA